MPCKGRLFHKWSEWELYQGECREWKKCSVCGRTKERNVGHTFSEWEYFEESSCYQKRKCTRCGYEEKTSKQKHCFGEWEYFMKSSCYQKKKCTRCGYEKESYGQKHCFGEYQYINDITCEKERKCFRCGGVEKIINHQWSEEISNYIECIDYAIVKAETMIEERELMLNNMRMKSINSMEYDENYKKQVEEISELKMRIAEYERLKKHAHPCQEGRVCTRCGTAKEEIGFLHHWSAWEKVLYAEETHMETQRRVCNVCGVEEVKRIERKEEQ